MYHLEESKSLSPTNLASLISSSLYEHRFGPYFIEPVMAGLDPITNEPFICSMDLIGCTTFPNDFVAAGTCASNLVGICETLYEPNLEPEDLFETISQCLVNAVDRDALSGWGAVVYIVTPEKVIIRDLKARMD